MTCAVCGEEFDHSRSDGKVLLREILDHYEEAHDASWLNGTND